MNIYQVLKKPLLTEKNNLNKEERNQVVFAVAKTANKIQIRLAVESVFKVSVLKVGIINMKKKPKRMGRFAGTSAAWKKAIVTLKSGDKIDYFEGA